MNQKFVAVFIPSIKGENGADLIPPSEGKGKCIFYQIKTNKYLTKVIV